MKTLVYYDHDEKTIVIKKIPANAPPENYIDISDADPYWHCVEGDWDLDVVDAV